MAAVADSFWKFPRDGRAGVLQLARRQVRGAVPFIHTEIQTRMRERSEVMRPVDGGVLDISLGFAQTQSDLMARFPDRSVTSVRWMQADPVVPMGAVRQFFSRLGVAQRGVAALGPTCVVTALDALDHLPSGQAMVWSNGLLHRLPDPVAALQQFRRSLIPGGALFFACLGPDTAQELRDAAESGGVRFPDYADMHDWGDLLMRSGFSDPVMEMERLVLTYTDPGRLLSDWHALEGNSLAERTKGLRGRAFHQSLCKFLQNRADGRLQLTLEILYGHAWRVDKPAKSSEFVIPLSDIRRKP